jgi:hypothetical protein
MVMDWTARTLLKEMGVVVRERGENAYGRSLLNN